MNLRAEKVLKFLESKFLYVHLNWVEETLHQIDVSLNDKQLEQQIIQYLLNSDIKKSLTFQSCLPADIFDKHNQVLPGPYCLQIIHVQDIGISIFNQLEYLEQFDESGTIKSYNVIWNNLSDIDDDEILDTDKPASKKFCKLLLEDSSGLCVWAIEHKPIKHIHIGINLGTKILLKNILVLRGVLILNPSNITFLGGQIFELNKNYFPSGLKNQLKSALYNMNI
ncbi:hypothetical protein PNEG_01030 [Pneumocystis murina B123]|uniref:RecQ-mediated genome instability protein 1 n=1 Tax=Pneumocystis murina (strain B123) TaxID=1069680 RepID=M7PKA6_PNEMU|nr:hypothetical protein PNEG_01030 [Pneumocystis murina B123]EMR10884.1 hypothetical protein PNEG_01030 [Pneumocystis murina B123]